MEIIGKALIDTGLIIEADLAKELWRVKDFASDLLVLCLVSAKTAGLIMLLPVSYPLLSNSLLFTFFFMSLHLYAVNTEDYILAKTRAIFVWSLLMFVLHVDGVHHTTKKNWLLASVAMIFLFLRDNVTKKIG